MKGKGVVAKLLFLISVCMNFPYYCNTIYLIKYTPVHRFMLQKCSKTKIILFSSRPNH